MKRLYALILVLLILLPYAIDDTAAQPESDSRPAEVDPRVKSAMADLAEDGMMTVIVTLHDQADLSQIPGAGRAAHQQGVIQALKAKSYATQRDLRQLLALRGAQGKVDHKVPFWVFNGISVTATAEVIQELATRDEVASITPDEIVILPATPLAQSAPETNLSAINAPDLWALGIEGQSVIVANVDSGVDVTHPDLASRYRGGTNSWYDPYGQHPASPIDLTGHGTSTMGVMVGGDGGGSAIGVAPGAQWIAARIWNDSGGSTATAIHQAFQWLLDPDGDPATADGPHVVNNSWTLGIPGCDLSFQLDLQALRAAGILPVFAAGNYGPDQGSSVSPSNNPEAFAVGAVYDDGTIYGPSSRGPSACDQSVYPQAVAPGVGIHTTDLYGFYTDASGTSLSAPHVAGGLALLISAFPNMSVGDQEAALINGAADLGSAGPDDIYGNGQIDLLAAYQWLQNNQTPPTPTPTPTSTPDANVNLALNQSVSVSSFRDVSATGGMAVDGDLSTMWQTERARGKNKLPTEWIKVDLGATVTIGRAILEWGENFATAYEIRASNDDVIWTTLYATSSGDGSNDTIIFSPTQARYVMLETSAWSSGSQRNWLREFEVYAGSSPAATATPTAEPTATPTAPGSVSEIHVGDLAGLATTGKRNRWEAAVIVTIHDANETIVSGATISGSWSNGTSGSGSCSTDGTGQCNITKANIKGNVSSVTFTVDTVSHDSMAYQPSANHDPDGDGNSVTVWQP